MSKKLPLRYIAVAGHLKKEVGDIEFRDDYPYKVTGFQNNGHKKTRLELHDPEKKIKARYD